MLYREIIAVCSEIHTKHTNTLCGQNVVPSSTRTVCYRTADMLHWGEQARDLHVQDSEISTAICLGISLFWNATQRRLMNCDPMFRKHVETSCLAWPFKMKAVRSFQKSDCIYPHNAASQLRNRESTFRAPFCGNLELRPKLRRNFVVNFKLR